MNKEEPYLIETQIITHYCYNPNYGDDRKCRCGHHYCRHFDSYYDDYYTDVGCKYCCCDEFTEDTAPHYENTNGV